MIITKCIITYSVLYIINFAKLIAGFFPKSFKISYFFYVMLNLPVIIIPSKAYLYGQTKL